MAQSNATAMAPSLESHLVGHPDPATQQMAHDEELGYMMDTWESKGGFTGFQTR